MSRVHNIQDFIRNVPREIARKSYKEAREL